MLIFCFLLQATAVNILTEKLESAVDRHNAMDSVIRIDKPVQKFIKTINMVSYLQWYPKGENLIGISDTDRSNRIEQVTQVFHHTASNRA